MVKALTSKLSGFFRRSDEAAADLIRLCDEVRTFAPGETIAEAGGAYRDIYLVRNGWVLRSRMLESGARQIVNVAMAGDFLCLNAMIHDLSDFDIVAKTAVEAYCIDQQTLRGVLGRDPVLAAAIFWMTAHEESMLAERIVSLGRRTVRQRTAHVLCEFISRLEILHGQSADKVLIPLTQEDFADIMGTSLVHANKTLRALDREEIIRFRNGVLTISDRAALQRIAGFDTGYLHFTRAVPRQVAIIAP